MLIYDQAGIELRKIYGIFYRRPDEKRYHRAAIFITEKGRDRALARLKALGFVYRIFELVLGDLK